jgi:uncharacterized protein with PIN domain
MDQIRFYMDEHVAKAVTQGLRRRGVDVVTAQEAGLHPAEDNVHLERATTEGRVVFTQDADFLRLHAAGVQHSGIAYAPQHTPVGYIVRRLLLIVDVLTSEEMKNHVEFL